ncbi:MAG: porin [Bacteroidetes bacterium]|nr:porin [Bacteroidota bacterium]
MRTLFYAILAALGTSAAAQDTTAVNRDQTEGVFIDNYLSGKGITFRSADEDHRLNLGAYVQSTYEFETTESFSDYSKRFRIRRARLTFNGSHEPSNISYRLRLDFAGQSDELNNGVLQDAWVSWSPNATTRFYFGQRRLISDNRELTIASDQLAFIERSRVTLVFGAIRDFGIYYDGRFALGENFRVKPALSIVTGDGQNTMFRNRGGFKYEGRIDLFLNGYFIKGGQFYELDLARERVPKIMLGVYYSTNQGISDRRGRESGTILYLDEQMAELLPDYNKIGVDLMLKYKGFSVLGEWVNATNNVPAEIFYRVRTDGSISSVFDNGVENYISGRQMLGSGFNVQMSYLTRSNYAVALRYTNLNPAEFSFLDNPLFFARNTYYEMAFSRLLSRGDAIKIQLQFILTDLEEGAENFEGEVIQDQYELTGRFLVQFSL